MALSKWLRASIDRSVLASHSSSESMDELDGLQEPPNKQKRCSMSKSEQVVFFKMHMSWVEFLNFDERTLNALITVENKIRVQRSLKTILPPDNDVHRWSRLCSPDDVKVVILGQDPYPTPGRATGSAFSTGDGTISPSLRNIYKELHRSIPDFELPTHGCLDSWSSQGVLLLNTTFTVVANQAGSHSNIGWTVLTDHILTKLSSQKSDLVFMFWGTHAKSKVRLINAKNHKILMSAHPSPLANAVKIDGFQGNNHFADANSYLSSRGKDEINWNSINKGSHV